MAIFIYEKPTSRASTLSLSRGSQVVYDIFVLADDGEDESTVIAEIGLWTSYFYTGFQLLTLDSISVSPRGGPYWEGKVTYKVPNGPTNDGTQGNNSADQSGDQPDPADNTALDGSFSFEVGGGTTHISQSIYTQGQYPAAGFAFPPTNNIIGISKDKVVGCDIETPEFSFTVTQVFQTLTLGYIKNLRYLVGKINDETFLSFPAYEVLLKGVSGNFKAGNSSNPVGSWELTFKFAAKENGTTPAVGEISPFPKNGWDYVWFWYQDKFDSTTGLTLPTPTGASVERVYESADFSNLGISLQA